MAVVRKSLAEIKAARPKVDRARIKATTEADIHRHAAEDGNAEFRSGALVLPPKQVRAQLGMTQERFAAALRIPLPTLRNWEQGRTLPDPAARALLMIVSKEPDIALRALESL